MWYWLMHRRIAVAELDIDEDSAAITGIGEVVEPAHIPVGIGFAGDKPDRKRLNDWWSSRAIPANRTGIRDALEFFEVTYTQQLLMKCCGLSLSDQYWVNPADNPLDWDKVNCFDNPFSEDVGKVLFGELPDGKEINLRSPDIATNGFLKKRWENNNLFKGGVGPFHQEPLNEEIAATIMRRLNIPHVRYFTVWRHELPYSVCENFINRDTELVSAWQIGKAEIREENGSLRQHFINCCDSLGIPDVRESIDKMLVLDYLIANEDRHWGNFGAVRNAETLEWLGLAPVFDCGNSLWHNKNNTAIGVLTPIRGKPFCGSHEEHIGQITDFSWLDLSALNGLSGVCSRILLQSPYIDRPRREALCGALESRIESLDRHIREHTGYAVSGNDLPDENEDEWEP